MSLVVMALAEPEPYMGHRFGYAGVGLPLAMHGGMYNVPRVYGRSHIISSHIAQPARIAAPVQPESVAAVPYSVPQVSPYVSTASVKAVPATPSSHQFHRQSELGNYEYGYDNVNSARHEVGNAGVAVRGSYTVKANGVPQTVHYVADALGYRVTPAHSRMKRQAAIVPSTPLATRPAVMMRIMLNPGHATFYRVY